MNRFLLTVATLGVALLGGVLAPALRADEWDKKTTLTVNQPVEVQGTVLAPGQYVMKLFDSTSSRSIVQIFNADQTQLVTTIIALPNYRMNPTGDTALTFYETPAGQPRALRAWFYPGDTSGVEFRESGKAMSASAHTDGPTSVGN